MIGFGQDTLLPTVARSRTLGAPEGHGCRFGVVWRTTVAVAKAISTGIPRSLRPPGLVLLLLALAPPGIARAQNVAIPDANLRAVIVQKLGKSAGDPITAAELRGLTGTLNASRQGIADLTGLEHATGLGTLFLEGNQTISDISPLRGLTSLRVLHLNNNRVSNISALQNLTNLRTLLLEFNEISNISPLRGLINLKL